MGVVRGQFTVPGVGKFLRAPHGGGWMARCAWSGGGGLLGSHWIGACRLGRRGAAGSLQGGHQPHHVLGGR